jgi:hypothetical protein
VRRYCRRVYSIVRALTADDSDAEDKIHDM